MFCNPPLGGDLYAIILVIENTMVIRAFKRALLSELYIVAIVCITRYGLIPIDHEPTLFIPIIMLSLFVLSAAVMGYLFLAEPIKLYLDGEKIQATRMFFTTVVIFACITAGVLFTFSLTTLLTP